MLLGFIIYKNGQKSKIKPSDIPERDLFGKWELIDRPEIPKCDFWNPWNEVLGPQNAQDVFSRLELMASEKRTFEQSFQDFLEKRGDFFKSDHETICIDAILTNESVSVRAKTKCQSDASELFGDARIELSSVPSGEKDFIQKIDVTIGLGELSVKNIRKLLKMYNGLIHKGLKGWQQAIPGVYESNKNGLHALLETSPQENAELHHIVTSFQWASQKMYSDRPSLAEYMLGLSNLITLNSDFTDAQENIFTSVKSLTVNQTLEVKWASLPSGVVPYVLKSEEVPNIPFDRDWSYSWFHNTNIKVNFRGIVIDLNDFLFKVDSEAQDDFFKWTGKFEGISGFEVSGSYRDLSINMIDSMINEVITEYMAKEIKRLKSGNNGEGFHYTIEAGKGKTQNKATIAIRFESPVNMIEVARSIQDDWDNPVLPNARSKKQARQWLASSFQSLNRDYISVGNSCLKN